MQSAPITVHIIVNSSSFLSNTNENMITAAEAAIDERET